MKRRILALVLTLAMAVGLVLPTVGTVPAFDYREESEVVDDDLSV